MLEVSSARRMSESPVVSWQTDDFDPIGAVAACLITTDEIGIMQKPAVLLSARNSSR